MVGYCLKVELVEAFEGQGWILVCFASLGYAFALLRCRCSPGLQMSTNTLPSLKIFVRLRVEYESEDVVMLLVLMTV